MLESTLMAFHRAPFTAWWIVGGRSSLERYGEGELNAASASVASARSLYFIKLHWRRNMIRAAIKGTINYCLNDRPRRRLFFSVKKMSPSQPLQSIGWATHEIESPFHFGTPILFPERILIMHKHILIDGGQCEHSLTDCGLLSELAGRNDMQFEPIFTIPSTLQIKMYGEKLITENVKIIDCTHHLRTQRILPWRLVTYADMHICWIFNCIPFVPGQQADSRCRFSFNENGS